MKTHFVCQMLVASILLAACSKDESAKNGPAPEGLNDALTIPGGSVVSGFEQGQLRKELELPTFSISNRPITWAQYRSCIDAKTCSAPALDCSNVDGDDQDAALCVGEANARAYCAWSGGRLAHLSEWFLAARGRNPQRFSWGDGAATCDQHPLASDPSQRADATSLNRAENAPEEGNTECDEPLAHRFRVGRHEAGASTFGLEDVLLANGELLGTELDGHFSVCANPRGCIVYGLIPGAIDAVKSVDEAAAPASQEQLTRHPYTFRCVWSEEGS